MKVLIVYATNEGQTLKIVKKAAARIEEMGHEAVLHSVDQPFGDLKLDQFDKIAIAGSVHDHRHQEALELYVHANRNELDRLPTLFISVSLAAAFEESVPDAQGYVKTFCESTRFRPSSHMLVAGALRHGHYGYYEEMTLRHRVLADRSIEDPHADREFTDWDAVARSVSEFIGGAPDP